jgi:hypothetical protein
MMNTSMSRIERAYYSAFFLAVLICWSPFKALAYVAPFLVVIMVLWSSANWRIACKVFGWFGAWIVLMIFHSIIQFQFFVSSAILSLITYGTALVIIAIPAELVAGRKLWDRIFKLVIPLVSLEAVLGILQAIYGAFESGSFDIANGDRVAGTIHIAFAPDFGFGNSMFAINFAFLLLAVAGAVAHESRKNYRVLILGGLALVLASVVHVLVFLLAAITGSILIFKPAFLLRKAFLRPIIAMVLCGLVFLTANLASLPYVVNTMAESPRALVLAAVFLDMPLDYPAMSVVGLGPGQFSSRASMISTGLYFGGPDNPKPVPGLSLIMPRPVRDYLIDIWSYAATNPDLGSTQQPLFSWLSIYGEFGAPVLLALFAIVLILLFKVRSRVTPETQLLAIFFGAGVLFLLLLGAQENYWEVPQAILLGVMLLKVMYGRLIAIASESSRPVVPAQA